MYFYFRLSMIAGNKLTSKDETLIFLDEIQECQEAITSLKFWALDNKFDVVVIGSGPSGFASAITAARKGKNVALVERNDKLAKKIYATGNGRCNFLNTKSDYYDEAIEFSKSCALSG